MKFRCFELSLFRIYLSGMLYFSESFFKLQGFVILNLPDFSYSSTFGYSIFVSFFENDTLLKQELESLLSDGPPINIV